MGLKIINKVKYNPLLYRTWFWVGSFIMNILKFFIKKDKKLIVFVSFGGRKYDDSPRAIFEEMIRDKRFVGYDFVWAFLNPDRYELPMGRKIKIDTLSYYLTLLKATCWITNSSVERGLQFKGKNTFYVNTWHGIPIKKMGTDIALNNKSFGIKNLSRYAPYDMFIANGDFDSEIFTKVFRLKPNSVKVIGYPRNDDLVSRNNQSEIDLLKKKIGLPLDKKILLYAPTFREYSKDEKSACTLLPPIDWQLLEEKLGNEYIVLFRAHYEVVKIMDMPQSEFIRDVSNYPALDELMLISDCLISDYSSIFFDYSILNRPMITFCYDYNEYSKKRGMYFDIRKELGNDNPTQEKLVDYIISLDTNECSKKTKEFKNKFMQISGNSSRKCCDIVFDNIPNE